VGASEPAWTENPSLKGDAENEPLAARGAQSGAEGTRVEKEAGDAARGWKGGACK
jgi:hypothetical protein